jgi:hypothetical protein
MLWIFIALENLSSLARIEPANLGSNGTMQCKLLRGDTETDRKLNNLLRYDTAQIYTILHRVVQHLSQHNLKIWHHNQI